jgi:hypothetical protein
VTQPDSHDDQTLWASPGPTPPTVATSPYPPADPTAAGYPPPSYPPPGFPPSTVAPAPSRRNRRLAIIAGVAAVVVAAVVTTVVLVFSGPSVGDVAGTWRQQQSMAGMGVAQTLVVSGDRFTYTLALTAAGNDDLTLLGGGLLGGLLGAPAGGGLSAGVECAGRVDVDGDRFVFASSTGPCGTLYGTLHGKTLTVEGNGRRPSSVDLVRQ